MRARLAGVLVAFLFAVGGFGLFAPKAEAGLVRPNQMFFFGDSLSDNGNLFALTQRQFFGIGYPFAPYFQGRFSNGPTWAEELSADLGLNVRAVADPAFRGGPVAMGQGYNLAFGGAKSDFGGVQSFIPGLFRQAQAFYNLTQFPGNAADPDALYVIWIGGNDFLEGERTALNPLRNVDRVITALNSIGAENFLLVNLPDLGRTPGSLGSSEAAALTAVSREYNRLMPLARDYWTSTLGVSLEVFDIGSLFDQILTAPSAFGFSNVTQTCIDAGVDTSACSGYLFFDGVHPTRAAHQQIADRMGLLFSDTLRTLGVSSSVEEMAAFGQAMFTFDILSTDVNEPASLLLLAGGVALLAAARWRPRYLPAP
jgi:thermolabile hemolysin